MSKFKTYWIAFLFIVLGLLALYGALSLSQIKTPVQLVEVKGTLKDYNFANNHSGRNFHYLWLREHKAVFQCDEYRWFGNEVSEYARQDMPVTIHIRKKDKYWLTDESAAIEIRGLTIGSKVLFEKKDFSTPGMSSLLLMAAIGLVFTGLLIILVQRWLVK